MPLIMGIQTSTVCRHCHRTGMHRHVGRGIMRMCKDCESRIDAQRDLGAMLKALYPPPVIPYPKDPPPAMPDTPAFAPFVGSFRSSVVRVPPQGPGRYRRANLWLTNGIKMRTTLPVWYVVVVGGATIGALMGGILGVLTWYLGFR